MKEIRVYGPPGVGKTTWLAKQIERARKKYFPHEIMVSSFTRAAAEELRSRDLSIPASSVGTLHAHCYRLLEYPNIAEANSSEFSEAYPHFAMRNGKNTASAMDDGVLPQSGEDPEAGSIGKGDELLARYSLARNKLTPRALWPASLSSFASAWEGWKTDSGYFDFTDLIERSLATIPVYEGKEVGLIDEAQDLTPLQLSLVRQWGENMTTFVLVGDDDQAIYGFAGASPEAFLAKELPPEHEIVLNQSYRVPRVVQAAAQKWISGVSCRKEKDYKPRDYDGDLLQHPGNFKRPITLLNDAEQYLDAGKTVMFLAPCSFQLQPIVAELRKRGWPYHNPYRKSRGDWNPLSPGKGVSTAQRLLAYLDPGIFPMDWYPEQLIAWGEMMTADAVFNRGIKGKLGSMPWPLLHKKNATWEENAEAHRAYFQMLDGVFKPGMYEVATKGDMEWLLNSATAEYQRRLEFPAGIVRARGLDALRSTPQITVGTIHSVKGGQADVTYLCPDVSAEAYKAAGRALASGDTSQRDEIIRQYYVGMTRCRETLVMARPATAFTAQQIRRMQ